MISINDESPIQRILALVERHAPRMMRAGGGGLSRNFQSHPPTPTTPELIARVRVIAAERPRTINDIAILAGIGPNHARTLMIRHGIQHTSTRKPRTKLSP